MVCAQADKPQPTEKCDLEPASTRLVDSRWQCQLCGADAASSGKPLRPKAARLRCSCLARSGRCVVSLIAARHAGPSLCCRCSLVDVPDISWDSLHCHEQCTVLKPITSMAKQILRCSSSCHYSATAQVPTGLFRKVATSAFGPHHGQPTGPSALVVSNGPACRPA